MERLGVHELILLFDTSVSMAGSDPGLLAPDALMQMVGSLPSSWHMGLVAFDTEIVTSLAPAANMHGQINTALGNISYAGEANFAAGLQHATDLFSEDALSRTLILMTNAQLPTDGLLPEEMGTHIIESDIRLHTILVGSNFDIFHREELSVLTRETGGILFENVPPEGLASVAIGLIFHQGAFHVAAKLVDAVEQGNGRRTISIDLPTQGLNAVKILMLSMHGIQEIYVGDVQADIQYGQIFTTVTIPDPRGERLEVEITAPDVREVFVMFEWDLQIMAEWDTGNAARIWLENRAGQNVLFDPVFAENISSLFVMIDGFYTDWLPLEDGYLMWRLESGERMPQKIQVFFDELAINLSTQEGSRLPALFVEAGVEKSQSGGLLTMRNAYLAICALGVLALAFLIYIRFVRRAKVRTAPVPVADTKVPPTTVDEPIFEPAAAAVLKTPIAPKPAKAPVEEPEIGADIVLKTPIAATPAPKPAATRPVAQPAVERPAVKPAAAASTAKAQPTRSAAAMVMQSVGGSFTFAGKIDVYVNKITTGKSNTTLAYRLIRIRGKRKHSLQALISKNQIKQYFPGIERIHFAVNAQGALEVTHSLDRAIMIGEHSLIRGHNHVWGYGEKLSIPCEKGERELVVSPTFMYRPN